MQAPYLEPTDLLVLRGKHGGTKATAPSVIYVLDIENRPSAFTEITQIMLSKSVGETELYVIGKGQVSISVEFACKILSLSEHIHYQPTLLPRRNAADYQIAYLCGKLVHRVDPDVEVVIVSGDKGFELIIECLRLDGLASRVVRNSSAIGGERREPDEEAADAAP